MYCVFVCKSSPTILRQPANCAHLLDFNVGHGFYAAFNNANPQKSHPPIYKAAQHWQIEAMSSAF